MNLYAIIPSWSPGPPHFELVQSDEEALEHAIFTAARDLTKGYRSPSAEVYLIARDVQHIGTAHASDAPSEWQWAHPAVEEALAEQAVEEAAYAVEHGA